MSIEIIKKECLKLIRKSLLTTYESISYGRTEADSFWEITVNLDEGLVFGGYAEDAFDESTKLADLPMVELAYLADAANKKMKEKGVV